MIKATTRKEQKRKWLYVPALVSMAICFLFCLFAPMELLFANEYEFNYNLYDLLQYMLPLLLLCWVCLTGALALLHHFSRKGYLLALAVLFAVFAAAYIQGTFFAGNLPPMDGRKIIWSEYSVQRVASVVIWGSVFASAIMVAMKTGEERFEKLSACMSGLIILILAIAISLTCITTGGYRDEKRIVHSAKDMMALSQEDNLVLFLMDAVDGEEFQKVCEVHPEYAEFFEDFTSFTNVTSVYPYTSRSVPYILSGEWFENKEDFGAYCNKAFTESPLIKELKRRGYRIGLYDPEFFFVSELDGMFENISSAKSFIYPDRFVKMQLMMAGYRYLPFDLKPICLLTPENIYIDTLKKGVLEDEEPYPVDNLQFQDLLERKEVELSDKKCFRFLYIRGAHEPFIYPAQSDQLDDNSYDSSIELCVTIAAEYLRKLKEADVFDNTAILFLADHGYVEDDIPFGRQNPFLLVKGIGEKHPFAVSDAPVTHEDLQTAYRRLLDGAQSKEAFDAREGDERQRRFLFFEYEKEEKMWEYYQTGHASDEETMLPTGEVYIYREN